MRTNPYNQTSGLEDSIEGVICDVDNCAYNNHQRQCTASQIKVGPQYANTSSDTVCDTFKP